LALSTSPLYPLSLHDALPISRRHIEGILADPLPARIGQGLISIAPLASAPQTGRGRKDEAPLVSKRVIPVARQQQRAVEIDEARSEEHTSELQSPYDLVCRLL